MITNLHTYKNKVASKNICDIYASLKYYDKNQINSKSFKWTLKNEFDS